MSQTFQNVITVYPPLRFTLTYKGVSVSGAGYDEREGPSRPYYWNEDDVVDNYGLDALKDEAGLVLSSIGEEPVKVRQSEPERTEESSAGAERAKSGRYKPRREEIDSSGVAAALRVILDLQLQRRRLSAYRDRLVVPGARHKFWEAVTGRPSKRRGFIGKMIGTRPGFTSKELDEQRRFIDETAEWRDRSKVKCVFAFEPKVKRAYDELRASWRDLIGCRAIWMATRGKGSRFDRTPVEFDGAGIGEVESGEEPMHFVADSGAGVFIYPAFVAVEWPDGRCAVMDLRRVGFRHSALSCPESGLVPSDARILGQTYSGSSSSDGKAASVPTVAYGDLVLSVGTNLKQRYVVSDIRRSEAFAKAFEAYKESYRYESDLFKPPEDTEEGLF